MHDNRIELMKYRLEMAEERLKFSKILLDAGSWIVAFICEGAESR